MMTDKISKILGVIALFLNTFIQGVYTGFGAISTFCEVKYPIIGNLGWVTHLDPYDAYFGRQRFISLFLIVFLVGKNIKNKWISHSISILCLFTSIYLNLTTIYYKKLFWDTADNYMLTAREMFNYDAIISSIIFTLLILEFVLIYKHSSNKKNEIGI